MTLNSPDYTCLSIMIVCDRVGRESVVPESRRS